MNRGLPVAARANFIALSTASAPVLAKNAASSPAGRRAAKRLREHAGEHRVVQLHAVDQVRVERRVQHGADVGVAVAEAGEALAAVHVEVRAPILVVEVGAAGRAVRLVEAEDAKHLDQRWVQVP